MITCHHPIRPAINGQLKKHIIFRIPAGTGGLWDRHALRHAPKEQHKFLSIANRDRWVEFRPGQNGYKLGQCGVRYQKLGCINSLAHLHTACPGTGAERRSRLIRTLLLTPMRWLFIIDEDLGQSFLRHSPNGSVPGNAVAETLKLGGIPGA